MSTGNAVRQDVVAPHAEPAFRQLCHILSLSRTGKVQSAVDSLVLTTLGLDPKVGDGGDPNEVATAVATYFGVTLDLGDVRLAIETHLKAGRLLIDRTSEPKRIMLAPATRASLARRVDTATTLEADVRNEWLELVQGKGPNCEATRLWSALQSYLGHVFKQHGAEAVQLLDSSSGASREKGTLPGLLDRAIDSAGLNRHKDEARECLRAFFQNPSPNRLHYLSELLDGTFTFFALTVSDATAEYLRGQVPSLKIFLDTNVVLAVLGFQDNPLQEADLELLEIVKRENYPFKLYCHERTLKETADILDAARNSLKSRHFTPAMSRAYLQYMESRGGGFGVEKQFHTLNAQRETDVEVFLSRFNHVDELLREKGISRYNQAGSELLTESKGALIAEFEHYLTERSRNGRPARRYVALDHDITVWMYLQRQRVQATNALRSGALLLSNDYSLHAFDRNFLMQSESGRRVPTVVMPHHLLQILRPFNRVTVDFDKRFMEIFAAPEFRTAQTDYGRTASRVLSYLSGFEGVPTETAVHILNDDLLMGRLEDVEANEVDFASMIESAVINENKTLVSGMNELGASLSQAELDAQSARETAEAERRAREDAEAQSNRVAAAAAQSVRVAVAELDATRKREAEESDARKLAMKAVEQEAAEKQRLQRELEEERRKRTAAEATVANKEKWSARYRAAVASMIAVVAIVVITWGPSRADFDGLLNHPNERGIRGLGILIVLGVSWVAGGGTHRSWVLSGVVLASVVTVISIL